MDTLARHLYESLKSLHHQFPQQRRLVVGFSGGLDSVVLLHVCVHTQDQWLPWFPEGLHALHVHHGLSANADDWLAHCQKLCADYQVPLTTVRVQLASPAGEPASNNIEERARDARYQAFRQHVRATDALLLAHHQDDQAETVLLRLLRGAGERGLAGMPTTRMLTPEVPLHRPWLTLPRAQLETVAQAQGLQWVEDESNQDDRYDRNYLRLRVIPQLEQRWPAWRQTVTRSAQLSSEADKLLAGQTDQYLRGWIEYGNSEQAWYSRLPRKQLLGLGEAWGQRVLRLWLHQESGEWPDADTTLRCWRLVTDDSEAEPASRPQSGEDRHAGGKLTDKKLTDKGLADQLIPLRSADSPAAAVHTRWPQQQWAGRIFKRYREHVYACPPDVDPPAPPERGYPWQPSADGRFPLLVMPGNGNLRWFLANEGGMRRPDGGCEVRYRQGGEEAALPGRPRRALKKILQEEGVVPWQRHRVPLIYVDDEIAWIGGVGVCEGHQAMPGEQGWALRWQDVIAPTD